MRYTRKKKDPHTGRSNYTRKIRIYSGFKTSAKKIRKNGKKLQRRLWKETNKAGNLINYALRENKN